MKHLQAEPEQAGKSWWRMSVGPWGQGCLPVKSHSCLLLLRVRLKFRGSTVFFLLELEIQIPTGRRVVLISLTWTPTKKASIIADFFNCPPYSKNSHVPLVYRAGLWSSFQRSVPAPEARRTSGSIGFLFLVTSNVCCFCRANLSNTSVLLCPAGSGAALTLQHSEGLLASRPGSRILPRSQLCSRHFAASHGWGRGI